MKKSKKILLSTALTGVFAFSLFPYSLAKAETVIPVKESNGKQYVTLAELVNAMGGTVTPNDYGTIYSLNDKIISIINDLSQFVTIGSDIVPIETKELDGITLPNFDAKLATDDKGDVLFPISILEKYLGIKPSKEGFVVEKKEDTTKNESTSEGTTSNGGSSSNSSSTSSSGNSSGSNKNPSQNSGNSSGSNNGSTSNGNGGSSSNSGSSNSGGGSTSNGGGTSNNGGSTSNGGGSSTVTGASFASIKSALPGLGWTHDLENTFTYYGISGNLALGTICITDSGFDMGLTGYSDSVYNSVCSIINMTIPNGASKLIGMLNSDTSGTFTSDGRTVTLYYNKDVPIISIK